MSTNSTWEKLLEWLTVGGLAGLMAFLFGRKKQRVDTTKTSIETTSIDVNTVSKLRIELDEAWDLIRQLRDENEDQRIKLHESLKMNKKQAKDIAAIQGRLSVWETFQSTLKDKK